MTRQPLEKHIQAQCIRLLRSVGAKVYVIGRPPRRDSVHKGTGQTPGIPDLEAWLPGDGLRRELVKIEVKRPGGNPLEKRSAEQVEYAEQCIRGGVTYICGGVDEVLALLQARGLVKEVAHYRRGAAAAHALALRPVEGE